MSETVSVQDLAGPGMGAVRDAWLFTRGMQSVRIVRATAPNRMFLQVFGPEAWADAKVFDDVICCMRYQADVERHLVADGFSLERYVSERRTEGDRRGAARGADRRRF